MKCHLKHKKGSAPIKNEWCKEGYLQAVMNTVLDGLIIIDATGIVQSFNCSAEKIFGYRPDEVLGQNVKMLMPKSYKNQHDGYLDHYLTTGEKKVIGIGRVVSGKRKNGSEFPMELSVNEMEFEDTRMFVGIVRDISERKEMEQQLNDSIIRDKQALLKLQESVEQFQLLANSLSQLVWTADETGWIYWYNNRWYEYTGTLPKEMEGWGWQSVHDPKQLPLVMEKWQKSIATGETFDMVFPLRGADGIFRPFLTRGIPVKDTAGKVKMWVGTNTDITEQKFAQDKAIEALRISEERYDLTVRSMSIGVWDWDLATNELYWSKKLKDMLGITDENFKPHYNDFASRLHPDDREVTEKMLLDHLKHLCPYNVEYRLQHNNGEYIWIHAFGQGQWDANGEPIRMAGSVNDITERKEAEKQREMLIEKLAASNSELERFAYVASHDMQEPLRMVKNFSHLIALEYSDKLNDEGKEYINLVSDGAERMQAMINDLLEYARIGNSEIIFVPVDANKEIKHVLENLSSLIEESKAEITYDVFPQFQGNPVQFMRLMQNLIGNGLKYQNKAHTPKVHVAIKDMGDYWCFSVQDNGIGIDKAYIHQVFEPFKRLHVWEEYKGTGIGLAVCKKIVENHRGRIWVTSTPGEGSLFSFTLAK